MLESRPVANEDHRPMTSKAAYNPGDMIGGTPYRVLRVIGVGGMGTVYDTEDVSVGKRYVVKTLHAELAPRADLEHMMRQEGRALARVQHPHIVDVITSGKTADRFGLPYIVMEYLDGATLKAIMNTVALSHEDVLKIATELLEALYHMHDGERDPQRVRPPVLHRDIKPENIFLARTADGHIVKLLDLGIAILLDEDTHGSCGTPKYMAPEQFRRERLTPQTDLYQAGCVFFELLTRRHPFPLATTTPQFAEAHMNETPPRVSRFTNVPKLVDDVIASALAKDPSKRPRNAHAFMMAMHALSESASRDANTTLEDLKSAIERHTESGYEAYATAENTLKDALPPFVVATTARDDGPRGKDGRRGTGTVPMAPAVRDDRPPAPVVVPPPVVVAVDRAAPTRASSHSISVRPPTHGTEELLDGLDGALPIIEELRRAHRAQRASTRLPDVSSPTMSSPSATQTAGTPLAVTHATAHTVHTETAEEVARQGWMRPVLAPVWLIAVATGVFGLLLGLARPSLPLLGASAPAPTFAAPPTFAASAAPPALSPVAVAPALPATGLVVTAPLATAIASPTVAPPTAMPASAPPPPAPKPLVVRRPAPPRPVMPVAVPVEKPAPAPSASVRKYPPDDSFFRTID